MAAATVPLKDRIQQQYAQLLDNFTNLLRSARLPDDAGDAGGRAQAQVRGPRRAAHVAAVQRRAQLLCQQRRASAGHFLIAGAAGGWACRWPLMQGGSAALGRGSCGGAVLGAPACLQPAHCPLLPCLAGPGAKRASGGFC